MIKLDDIAKKYGTDKSSEYHNYTKIYTEWLKNRKIDSLLEVGYGAGSSIRMWMEYFPKANIYCIEYGGEEYSAKWQNPETNISELNFSFGDSTKPETWENIPDNLDILIDDGSHKSFDMMETFLNGFPKLKSGGLYFVEDTHCTFREEKNKQENELYKFFFDLVIQQQTPGVAIGGDFYQSIPYIEGIAKDILSYHFYKSVIVLEKC